VNGPVVLRGSVAIDFANLTTADHGVDYFQILPGGKIMFGNEEL
jgi:hypothetical protein